MDKLKAQLDLISVPPTQVRRILGLTRPIRSRSLPVLAVTAIRTLTKRKHQHPVLRLRNQVEWGYGCLSPSPRPFSEGYLIWPLIQRRNRSLVISPRTETILPTTLPFLGWRRTIWLLPWAGSGWGNLPAPYRRLLRCRPQLDEKRITKQTRACRPRMAGNPHAVQHVRPSARPRASNCPGNGRTEEVRRDPHNTPQPWGQVLSRNILWLL